MITVDLWLYGGLSAYGGEASRPGYANLAPEMPEGSTMGNLLDRFGIPLEEKGLTFVNGELTDMPSVGADLDRVLRDGDRIGIFSKTSMWPFQYRFGAATSPDLQKALARLDGGALHHSPASIPKGRVKGEE